MTFTEKLEKQAAKLVAAPEFQDLIHYTELKDLLESLAEARKDGGGLDVDVEQSTRDWHAQFEATLIQDVRRIERNVQAVQRRIEEKRRAGAAEEAAVLDEQLQQYVSLQHSGFLRLLSKYGKEIDTHHFQHFLPEVFETLGFPLPPAQHEMVAQKSTDKLKASMQYFNDAFDNALGDAVDDDEQRQEMLESREMVLALFQEVVEKSHAHRHQREGLRLPVEACDSGEKESEQEPAGWLAYFTPPLAEALKGYTRNDIQRDILAGFIISVAGIPKAMSYAKLADLPVGLGIATCYLPSIVYALLGASRQGAISPQSVTCLLLGQMIDEVLIDAGDNTKAERVNMAMVLTFATGLVIMAIGFCRLGFLLNFISRSVLSGFVSASAIIAALSTVKSLLGIHVDKSPIVYEMALRIAEQLGHIHWPTAAIGVTGVIYLLFVPAVQKHLVKKMEEWRSRAATVTRCFIKIPIVLHVMLFGLILGGALCSWHAFGVWTSEHVIVGLGATSPGVFLSEAMLRFDCQAYEEHLTTEYQGGGSGAALRALESNSSLGVDFVASDILPPAAELEAKRWQALPLLSTSICPVVHVPMLDSASTSHFILDLPLLTDMFAGHVTHWDDPRILALNPNLPWHSVDAHVPIHVVSRDSASGTTAAFEEALRTCAGCNATWAPGLTVDWTAPVTSSASGSQGVVAAVASRPWTVGYANVAEVFESHGGTARCAALRTGASDAASAVVVHSSATWPLTLTSYVLAPRLDHPATIATGRPRQDKCAARAKLHEFLSFLYARSAMAELYHYKAFEAPAELSGLLCAQEPSAARRLSEAALDLDAEDFTCKLPSHSCSSIEVVGPINSELPEPSTPRKHAELAWGDVARNAVMLAGVALLEHVANVQLYADRNDYSVSVAGDLVAVGLANCVGACFGSFVVACGLSRTALNESARSQLSLLFSAFVTFAVVYSVAPLLTMLPVAVLNIILFCAVAPLVDVKAVRALIRLRSRGLMDLAALFFAFFCTCFFGVVTGMMLAVGFSIIEFIRKSVSPQVHVLERSPGSLHYEPALSKPRAARCLALHAAHHGHSPHTPMLHTKVLRFEAPLWFANAATFSDRVLTEAHEPGLHGVVLDMAMVPWVDSTAANATKKMIDRLDEQGIVLYFAQANSDVKAVLQVVCNLGEDRFFKSIYSAEHAAHARGCTPQTPASAPAPAPSAALVGAEQGDEAACAEQADEAARAEEGRVEVAPPTPVESTIRL